MPSGVGFELIVVGALVAILLASVVAARRWRSEGEPVPAEASQGDETPPSESLDKVVSSSLRWGQHPEEDWQQLEKILIGIDVSPRAAHRIVSSARERLQPGQDPQSLIVDEVARTFGPDASLSLPDRLAVVMVVGAAGSGKTTLVGRLAHRLVNRGRLVALAGGGTVGANAPELAAWADRAGADLVADEPGMDRAAAAYRAVEVATVRGSDVLIVDTAGRKLDDRKFTDELAKMGRVLEKAAGRVDEILLVLEASMDQSEIPHARSFIDALGVTGIALSKFDGREKIGIVLTVREELGIPVKLVTTGGNVQDLRAFDANWFAGILVGDERVWASVPSRDSVRAASRESISAAES